MTWIKPLGAAAFLTMVCLNPDESLSAASESLVAWALSVVPSLLPFLIAAPALTSPEVCSLLARLSGPFLEAMRLPKNSTGALLIGLLSGSPAGACALSAVPADPSDPPGAYLRAALMASGASPAFLLTGIAVTMLEAPETGWLLLRSQLLSILPVCLLFRSLGSKSPAPAPAAHKTHGAVLSAMLTLMTIGGYMAFFAVLARLLTHFTDSSLEAPLLAVFELAGGCRALCSLSYEITFLLPLISAAACFGGISVFLQCMSFLAPLNIRPAEYAAGKLVQSAFAAVFTYLQLETPWRKADPLFLTTLAVTMLIFLLLIKLRTVNRRRAVI